MTQTQPFDEAKASAILGAAVSEVFSDMAFLDAQVSFANHGLDGKSVRAAIDVLKPASCRLELRLAESLRSRIFDILYVDGPPVGASEDAVLELLNVMAGSFLTEYFGEAGDIRLELPRYLYLNGEAEGQALVDLGFDVEGEALRVLLSSVRYRY
jgi:hypothetical protein